MLRIDVPPGETNLRQAFADLVPALWKAKDDFHDAVYRESRLPLREFEAARMRIAQINGCAVCQATRVPRDRPGRADWSEELPEEFYEAVADWRTADGFTVRERLALEFAERFATDHRSLDDDEAFWANLHEHFRDDELADLAVSIASSLAGGRIAHVFGIDVCDVSGRLLVDAM